jgi:hypothetical protein
MKPAKISAGNYCVYEYRYLIWNIKSIEKTISEHVQHFFAYMKETVKKTYPQKFEKF